MNAAPTQAADPWRSAWLDALAFFVGLGVAWFSSWNTTDLVWSLWLSSLVVGYSILVWQISATLREFVFDASRDASPGNGWARAGGLGVVLFGTLFGLAFFTVHFGGFHFGHSVFLNQFFPIETNGGPAHGGMPNGSVYAEVFRRYWIFLPAAFIAERAGFAASETQEEKAKRREAVAERRAVVATSSMTAPYRNVVRMHLLIFFFAGAHVLHLDHFIVYAVVYAVYFFPWRILRGERANSARP